MNGFVFEAARLDSTLFFPEIRAEMWQHLFEHLGGKEKASLTGRLSNKIDLHLLVVPSGLSFLAR
jgi:hypothetical protein